MRRRRSLALGTALFLALGIVAAVVFFVFVRGGGGEAERVARASEAANAALESRQFAVLYDLLATEVQATTTAADLQTRFGEAEETTGIIVAVERVSDPQVDGKTAVVETEVTYESPEGKRTVTAYYDLYIQESDEWRLVYSQAKEQVRPAATPSAPPRSLPDSRP